ncbi:MAG: hypothetical protein JW702_01460 [Clostridiales bacterium]|nr:hypothetical protein [Clostridiales bacterium]
MQKTFQIALIIIIFTASFTGLSNVTIAAQTNQVLLQTNGQIIESTQTENILALQWFRTDTYLNSDADLSLEQNLEKIPHSNYAYVDVRVSVSGSTASPYPSLLNEYQGAVTKLKNAGLKVIIRVRIPNQLEYSPSDPNEFWSTYGDSLVYYAQFCTENNVEAFCIATEMTRLEISEYNSQWENVISRVRNSYSGIVFYETNFWYQRTGTYDSTEQKLQQNWFASLDYIAVSAYWDIAPSEDATIEQMIAKWYDWSWYHTNVVEDELEALSSTFNKKIILVTGCASVDGAAMHPWKYSFDNPVVDLEEQRRWFESFFQVFHDESFVAGYMIDGGFYTTANKDPNNTEFTIQNKPAETTLESWFSQLNP